jgi:hypothetical protein
MSKLLFDNRAVGALMAVLCVVNSYLMMQGYYG